MDEIKDLVITPGMPIFLLVRNILERGDSGN